MAKQGGIAATATPQSRPSLATQLQTRKRSEFQQPSTQVQHSQDDSIASLRQLSDALSGFQCCFTELHQHINSIQTSIASIFVPNTTGTVTPLPASSPPIKAAPELSFESDPSEEEEKDEEEDEVVEVEEEKDDEEDEEEVEVELEEEEEKEQKLVEEKVESSCRSELESLCELMNQRDLRMYIAKHIKNIKGLCEQVPKALKLAPDPARLVLKTMGKFHRDGSKVYVNGTAEILSARKASVLILECFLLMGIDEGVVIDKSVKERATKAALQWITRINSEGGVGHVPEMDARGLLLLIGCFGIPPKFRDEDIRDLLQVSYIKRISDALRRSNVLKAKIPEIIERMVKNKMEVDAVHIAYTFGIEDRFNPQRILTSFLQESKESMEKMMQSQGSLAALNEAKKKHLSDLTSVVTCLGRHNIDPSALLPRWQLNLTITSLVKVISLCERITQKRKLDEMESSKRLSRKEADFSYPLPQQESVVNQGDASSTLLGVTAGQIYHNIVSPSVLPGPVAGSIHENAVNSIAGTVRGMGMGGVGAGISATCTEVIPLAGSYTGSHGGTFVNKPGQVGSHTGQLYGWREDAAMYDRLTCDSYAYRPSSYLEGSTGLTNTQASDAYRLASYLEGSMGSPNTQPGDVYSPPPYMERRTGFPNTRYSYAYRSSPSGLLNSHRSDAYKPSAYLEGSLGMLNALSSDVYRPPPSGLYKPSPYLVGSSGLPNTLPADVCKPLPLGLPITQPSDIYKPSPYLEGPSPVPIRLTNDAYKVPRSGLPNTIPGDTCRPPPYLEGSMGVPNAIPRDYRPNIQPSDAYRPPLNVECSTGLTNALHRDTTH